MNRINFQELAELRLRESKALLAAGFPEGAYYLAGYVIECALKACIAKRTREHDFPEKKLVNDSHTHNLKDLLRVAELNIELDTAMQIVPSMKANWTIILNWSESSRYEKSISGQEAAELLHAIDHPSGGLLQWIQLHW